MKPESGTEPCGAHTLLFLLEFEVLVMIHQPFIVSPLNRQWLSVCPVTTLAVSLDTEAGDSSLRWP